MGLLSLAYRLIEAALKKTAVELGVSLEKLQAMPAGPSRRNRHDDISVVVLFFSEVVSGSCPDPPPELDFPPEAGSGVDPDAEELEGGFPPGSSAVDPDAEDGVGFPVEPPGPLSGAGREEL